jgi:hypothetical protein
MTFLKKSLIIWGILWNGFLNFRVRPAAGDAVFLF